MADKIITGVAVEMFAFLDQPEDNPVTEDCSRFKFAGFKKAFTLIELLVVISIIFLLMGLLFPALSYARSKAYQIVCRSNIRQLVLANSNYANDNGGFFAPGTTDIYTTNLHRWYGSRKDSYGPFDSTKGPLAEYVNTKKTACSARSNFVKRDPSDPEYDDGSSGYGYNMIYIGSRIWQLGYDQPACNVTTKEVEISRPAQTLMFADTAMAKTGFYAESSFAEPRYYLFNGSFNFIWNPDPSIHFRHRRRANIGWSDSHVDSEKIGKCDIVNRDGIRPFDMDVGWFEPMDNSMFDLN
jgi:prepilin-type N-terminal cleavage/methylation domain-containing protein/prepilin-type processing-associated H-X9-DG protein